MNNFTKINENWYRRKDGLVTVRRRFTFMDYDSWQIFNTVTGEIYKSINVKNPTKQHQLNTVLSVASEIKISEAA